MWSSRAPWQADSVPSTRAVTTTVLASSLVVYSAQGLWVPVLAPVTRMVGLGEVDLGAIMTLSAAMLVVSGPWWGRQVDRHGVHRVLVRGLALATTGAVGFAVMAQIAVEHDLPRGLVLPVLALTRGLLYGFGFAAVPIGAMTYLASISTSTEQRTRLMGAFGATQGLALVVGPAVGGLLAIGGLLLPIHVAPVLLGATLAAVWFLPTPDHQQQLPGERLSPTDRRVLPYLVAGGMLFLGLAFVEIILGFLVQDRLGLTNRETAGTVAVAGVLIGVGFAVAQVVLAPRLGWAPRDLISGGCLVTCVGYVGAMPASTLTTVFVALVVIALGLGLAITGFNAGATLAVESQEHAAVAGLLTSTVGLTYVAGPLIGTALYAAEPLAPLAGAAVLTLVAAAAARRVPR